MKLEIWNPGFVEFTYFWKSQSPFSQWYFAEFEIDGINYVSSEQYMMAEKARLFGDEEKERLILAAKSPAVHKQLGRSVCPFEDTVWKMSAKNIVYRGNKAKFVQNKQLLGKLMETKNTLLVEASPYDKVWGIGIREENARNGEVWQGTNWLGEVLTKLRLDFEEADESLWF